MRIYDITPEIWKNIIEVSREYNVDPFLIAAIGQHETGWGALVTHNLYTGFGAFDEGFVDQWAGLRSQIEGTARKIQSWKMTPERTTLENLIKANRGDFFDGENIITSIYATDPRWAEKVWRWRNSIIEKTQEIKPDFFAKLNGEVLAEKPVNRLTRFLEFTSPAFRLLNGEVLADEKPMDRLIANLDRFHNILYPQVGTMPFWIRMIILFSSIILIILLLIMLVIEPSQILSRLSKYKN